MGTYDDDDDEEDDVTVVAQAKQLLPQHLHGEIGQAPGIPAPRPAAGAPALPPGAPAASGGAPAGGGRRGALGSTVVMGGTPLPAAMPQAAPPAPPANPSWGGPPPMQPGYGQSGAAPYAPQGAPYNPQPASPSFPSQGSAAQVQPPAAATGGYAQQHAQVPGYDAPQGERTIAAPSFDQLPSAPVGAAPPGGSRAAATVVLSNKSSGGTPKGFLIYLVACALLTAAGVATLVVLRISHRW